MAEQLEEEYGTMRGLADHADDVGGWVGGWVSYLLVVGCGLMVIQYGAGFCCRH